MKVYKRWLFSLLIMLFLGGISFVAFPDDEGRMTADVPLLEGVIEQFDKSGNILVVDGIRYHLSEKTRILSVNNKRASLSGLRPGIRVRLVITPEASQSLQGMDLAAVVILKPASRSDYPNSGVHD